MATPAIRVAFEFHNALMLILISWDGLRVRARKFAEDRPAGGVRNAASPRGGAPPDEDVILKACKIRCWNRMADERNAGYCELDFRPSSAWATPLRASRLEGSRVSTA